MFQNIVQMVKNNLFFDDSKRTKMALSSSKKAISIIKRNNFQAWNCLKFIA